MKNITHALLVLTAFLFFGHTSSAQNSLLFDGIDDYVEVPPFALNNLDPDQFTFEAWVEGTESTSSPHPMIFSNREYISGNWFGVTFFFHNFWSGSAHKMLAVQLDGINYMIYNNGSAGKILDGNCHHVAIAREGNILIFMVDGVDIGTRTIVGSPVTNSSAQMWIGRDPVVLNTSFTGKISDLRIWDRTRNWPEVQAEMNMPMVPGTPNLLGYWEMGIGGGQTAFDQSGFGFDGTLGSTPAGDPNDPIWDIMPCHPYRSNALSVASIQQDQLEINVYPNPVNSILSVEVKGNGNHSKLTIVSSLGQRVYADEMSIGVIKSIDVNEFPSGVYFLHIENDGGMKSVKKFIKK